MHALQRVRSVARLRPSPPSLPLCLATPLHRDLVDAQRDRQLRSSRPGPQALHGEPLSIDSGIIVSQLDDADSHVGAPAGLLAAQRPPNVEAATVSASRNGATSWTRNTHAPRSSASTFEASVPARRPGSPRP